LVVLAGGVGAARFLEGLAGVVPAAQITVVGNTADDAEIHGLHISPDLDTVTYTLAGRANPETGWGLNNDTFHCLEALSLYDQDWFRLGDHDLATHIYRSALLRGGVPLTEITARIARAHGVEAAILPMSDDRVRTFVDTPAGELDFQTYFARRKAQDPVRGVRFEGAATARPGPSVVHAISCADAVLLAPSNPIISIGPILAVPAIHEALHETPATVLAVSPIVAGRALKGPTVRMMEGLGHQPTCVGVARIYESFCDLFVIDEQDWATTSDIEALGLEAMVTNTVMNDLASKQALARFCLEGLLR
jgi:LPPG:FO 2-phospho-L-lactate transferase